jgi:hypothetical protein
MYRLGMVVIIPEPTYNPNQAAPAPTMTDTNADCALVGSGSVINHSVVR